MSDWRPSLLAAVIVLSGGGFVGAATADRSDTHARTSPRRGPSARAGGGPARASGKGQSKGQSTSPATDTTSTGIEVVPPANTRADTLTELNTAGDVDGNTVEAKFGTRTISGHTFQGVSTDVYRDDKFSTGSPWIKVRTKGRYQRVSGVVGITGDAQCGTDASMSITDAGGETLWGPERVTINSAKRFDISINGRIGINLVGRSLAESDDGCGQGLANPAWGDVKFVKTRPS